MRPVRFVFADGVAKNPAMVEFLRTGFDGAVLAPGRSDGRRARCEILIRLQKRRVRCVTAVSRQRSEILHEMAECVVEMQEERACQLAHEALESGIDPTEAIMEGFSRGMERVGELFDSQVYFVPEVIVAGDTMYAGIEVLRPHMDGDGVASGGTVVIGVVEGDTHDIGKNLVTMMLDAAGFQVIDLGRNVPLGKFTEEALATDADVVALSSLMTTTMNGMADVVQEIRRFGASGPKVMVGGAPVSQGFATRIGADGYAANASHAVKVARDLVAQERTLVAEGGDTPQCG